MDNLRSNWQNFKYLPLLDKLATIVLTTVITLVFMFVGALVAIILIVASYSPAFPYIIGFLIFVLGGSWAWNRVINK